MQQYDVIVIGAGPGGYVCAIRAAQLGQKVAIVEREHLGGICLNWGCIPTKALLKASEVYHTCLNADAFGINVSNVSIDFKKLVARSRAVAQKLSSGISHLMKKNKIDVIMGEAQLQGIGKISVKSANGDTNYTARNIVLAIGARPKVLPGLEPDGKLVWDYKTAMIPETLPKSLLVVGSGAIGIEFASFYNILGVEVTIVEIMDNILSAEDKEISQLARKSFEKRGIKIMTSTSAKILNRHKDNVEVELQSKQGVVKTKFDRVISAVGITPNTENIGLETVNITRDKAGFISTDTKMQTQTAGIYAIGDICAGPWLAHKASHEGIIAAEAIAGKHPHALDKTMIPGCTYCYPQIASVGLTEEQAKEQKYELKIGRFQALANGKAIAMGEDEGLIKVIFDKKTGELLGAHMIGAEVTELISALAVAKNLETTEQELINTIFAHPTLSEMIHESVLDAYGRAVHY